MARQVRILSVDNIEIIIQKSNPPQAVIMVAGTASTPGYKDVHLAPLEKVLSPDGILDLELVGKPPDGIVMQVPTPVFADYVVDKDVDRLVGAKVHARSNDMTALVSGRGQAQPGAEAAGGLTTFAVGEETPKTFHIGEEFPKTFRFGEEGPTTLRVGEEGRTWPTGENWPTTFAFGEEGPKTLAIGEEGPKPFFGESDPRVEGPGTGPVAEDFDPGFDVDPGPFGRRNR